MKIRDKVVQWGRDKGISDPIKQTLKTLSEAGELADAVCKSDLNKRVQPNGMNDYMAEVIDAIGDIEVCLIILKDILMIGQDTPLFAAYKEIKNRDGEMVNGTFVKKDES